MAAKALPLKGDSIRDFSGGPNLRDAPSEFAKNEDFDSWNITYDERGGVASRLGLVKYNGSTFDAANLSQQGYTSPLLATTLIQVGTKLYKGTSTVSVKTFTTSGVVTFAELNSLVIANHPVDGLFTSADGVTWVAVADADAPKGNGTCIATWQNKLWVGRTDGAVQWSAAGDATAWVATDFNKLWEHDQQGIVALHIASGQDILGRPGLLAFKQESFYRIQSATDGAYTTVDATIGAAGPKAVIGVGARVCWIGKRGIWWWREDQPQAVNASDRLLPLWDPSQTNYAQQALWAAGRKGNRAMFSLTRASSTANDLALEFHPEQDWIAPRSDAMSWYATTTGTTDILYGGSPTTNGQAYQIESGGTDDGVAISWRFQTRWLELNGGFNASVWKVRAHGRGSGTLTVRRDYANGGGDSQTFDLTATGNRYDTGLHWDSFTYSIPAYQRTQEFPSIGLCRQFSLIFSGSSTTTDSAPQVLGAGTAPTIGYFGLYGLEWLFEPLGLS